MADDLKRYRSTLWAIGQIVQDLRNLRRWSRRRLAHEAGVSEDVVDAIESPNSARTYRITSLLRVLDTLKLLLPFETNLLSRHKVVTRIATNRLTERQKRTFQNEVFGFRYIKSVFQNISIDSPHEFLTIGVSPDTESLAFFLFDYLNLFSNDIDKTNTNVILRSQNNVDLSTFNFQEQVVGCGLYTTKFRSQHDLVEALAREPHVVDVMGITGDADVLLLVQAPSKEEAERALGRVTTRDDIISVGSWLRTNGTMLPPLERRGVKVAGTGRAGEGARGGDEVAKTRPRSGKLVTMALEARDSKEG